MELPSKLLEQRAWNTRPKNEEHMLVVMVKSTHEEHLFQTLQKNNKQIKIAVTFLSGYNGIFNVTNKNNKFYFKESFEDGEFIQIRLREGAYQIESINREIKRIIIEKGHYTETDYPFRLTPNFSTLGSIVEILSPGPMISFVLDDSKGTLLGFTEILLWGKYKLSDNAVDILSFDNIFIETEIAQEMIFKGRQTGIIHNHTMDVTPGYKYIEKSGRGIQWYMVETKDFISSINLKLINEYGNLVSFNGETVTFRLSIKEV